MSAHDEKTLRQALQRIHHVATGQTTDAYMSIPADPKRDADLILSAGIDELMKLRAQRDELLAALKGLLRDHDDYCEHGTFLSADEARAAIAKAEGSET